MLSAVGKNLIDFVICTRPTRILCFNCRSSIPLMGMKGAIELLMDANHIRSDSTLGDSSIRGLLSGRIDPSPAAGSIHCRRHRFWRETMVMQDQQVLKRFDRSFWHRTVRIALGTWRRGYRRDVTLLAALAGGVEKKGPPHGMRLCLAGRQTVADGGRPNVG